MRAAARALAPARSSAPARAVARRRPAPIRRRRAARVDATATRASADDRDALDAFARATPRATRAFELLRESRRAIDAEAMTAMCYVGAIRRRRATRGETACVAKICERWSARVGGRLGRVRASLEAEDGSAAARAVAREVGKCEAEATALARRFAHEAIEATEAFETREAADDATTSEARGDGDGDGDGDGVNGIPEKWRMACGNVNGYLEYAGATLTFEEWARVREAFDAVVTEVDGDDASARYVRDDGNWNAMKAMMDDSVVRPRRLSQVENNARYANAKAELDEAKKAWKEANEIYKDARRRIKQARHEVHKTRKAVRIEYR